MKLFPWCISLRLFWIPSLCILKRIHHRQNWNICKSINIRIELHLFVSYRVMKDRGSTCVTAWIVAVAWIVAGDNSCRCLRHKSSPETFHAVSVSMNCRRRQFMAEIPLMLCTSPATIHAAWKKSSAYIVAVGIFWRHRSLYLFTIFFIYLLFFFLSG